MAYPANYYTPGGNLFTSTQNGVTTGMGGTVAAAPAPNYTTAQADSWMNGANGQGRSEFTGMNQVNQAFMSNLGRLPNPQDQLYYSNMISRGDDINSILAGIGQSPEAQAFGASGASNPYTLSSQIMQDRANGVDVGSEAYRTQYGIGLPTNNRVSNFDPNSAAAMEADRILAGGGNGGGGRGGMGRGGRPGMNGGAPGSEGFQPYNPYLTSMVDDITRRSQDALGQGLNMIDQQAIGAGGYGGSRQGVAQAGAIAQSNDNLTGQIANLLGGDWTNEQGRQVQRYGIDKSYDLGMTNATNSYNLGMTNANNNYNLGVGRLDLDSLRTGADIGHLANQDSWMPYVMANQIYGPWNDNGTTTTSGQSGGGVTGLLGGAGAGYQWWNALPKG